MAFRLAVSGPSPDEVDMDRVADWFLGNLPMFEDVSPNEIVPLPVRFLAAVSTNLDARIQRVESTLFQLSPARPSPSPPDDPNPDLLTEEQAIRYLKLDTIG